MFVVKLLHTCMIRVRIRAVFSQQTVGLDIRRRYFQLEEIPVKIKSMFNVVGAVLALSVSQASLGDEFSASTGTRPFTAGLGILYKDKPYRDYDSDEKTSLVPVILYEGESFFVRGGSLGWKFVDSNGMEFAAVGEYLADGYESSDSDYLRGMDDRDPSFGVGAHVIWNPDALGFKMTAVTDVADNSDGSQIRGEIFYKYRTGDWMFRPSAGFVWQSEDYNDYYYGVKSSEARSGRPAYSADDDINYRLGAVAIYQQKTSPWMFIGGLRYDILGDEIDDSPIVEDDNELTAVLGVAYTFGK
jgi:MipA family protein